MTTPELVRQYRQTSIGAATWPLKRRDRRAAGNKPPAPDRLKYRPVGRTEPDASPWDRAGYGGRAKLVLDTINARIAHGERWQPKDVAEAIGAPTVPVASHMKRLREARLIPYKRRPNGIRA